MNIFHNITTTLYLNIFSKYEIIGGILDSELSDKCIDFTVKCRFIFFMADHHFLDSSIFIFECGF